MRVKKLFYNFISQTSNFHFEKHTFYDDVDTEVTFKDGKFFSNFVKKHSQNSSTF